MATIQNFRKATSIDLLRRFLDIINFVTYQTQPACKCPYTIFWLERKRRLGLKERVDLKEMFEAKTLRKAYGRTQTGIISLPVDETL